MLNALALKTFLGFPLIAYGGLITLILLVTTLTLGYLNIRDIREISLKWYEVLVTVTLVVCILHTILGLSIFFNF